MVIPRQQIKFNAFMDKPSLIFRCKNSDVFEISPDFMQIKYQDNCTTLEVRETETNLQLKPDNLSLGYFNSQQRKTILSASNIDSKSETGRFFFPVGEFISTNFITYKSRPISNDSVIDVHLHRLTRSSGSIVNI